MTIRIIAALLLGTATISAAAAASRPAAWTGFATDNQVARPFDAPLGVHDAPFYESCPMSSAAEGNANQQTRPVKQYGQTSGGNRC